MKYSTIGIDISKHFLDICLLPEKESIRLENTRSGFEKFLIYLQGSSFKQIIMEDTGCYHKHFYYFMKQHYDNVYVINPQQIRYFARSARYLAKTDKIDAYIIAKFGDTMEFIAKMQTNSFVKQLKELSVRKNQLVNLRKQEKNHLESCIDETIYLYIQEMIILLNKQIKQIDNKIKDLINNDVYYRRISERLSEIQGVGHGLITTLLSELPELGYLNKRKISALVGIAPMNNDSGKMKGRRTIKSGRFNVRKHLYLATLSATKYNIVIKNHYQHLIMNGKPKKVAIVACMRKLIIFINSIFQKEFCCF